MRRVALVVAMVVGAGVVGLTPGPAQAITRSVATAADLRLAITEANGNPAIDLIEITASTITVPPGECNDVGLLIDGDNANASGDYDIDRLQPLTIRGVDGRTTINPSCRDRFFDNLGAGTLTLENLVLSGSDLLAIPDGEDARNYSGGAVRSNGDGDLIIRNSVFAENRASNAVWLNLGNPPPAGDGGAIYGRGNIRIEDSVFRENHAGNGSRGDAATDGTPGGNGGAVYGTESVVVERSAFVDNRAGEGGPFSRFTVAFGGVGGAIAARQVAVEDSRFEENKAGNGGLGTNDRGSNGGRGGAIEAINVSTIDTDFLGNTAGIGGGSDTAVSGSGGDGGAISSAVVDIVGGRFDANRAGDGGEANLDGGGSGGHGGAVDIMNGTFRNVDFVDNAAGNGGSNGTFGGTGGDGGAIAAIAAVLAVDVVAQGNRAGDGGNANAAGLGGNGGAFGGSGAMATPTFEVANSSFDGNRAGNGGVSSMAPENGFAGSGGAIHTVESENGALSATNVSFVRNRSGTSSVPDRAGTGAATATNNLTFVNVTVTDNVGPEAVANARTGLPSFDRITASVFGDNSGTNCDLAGPTAGYQSGGDNYEVGGATCVAPEPTDRLDQTELGLEPISTGSVGTGREPIEGGPLDAAIPLERCAAAFPAGVSGDQWGRDRPGGTGCEPGALEIVDVEVLPPGETAARFVELPPTRLFDTRPGEPGDGPKGKVPPGGTIEVQVRGRVGVPNDAVAVAINLTGADATDRGFVTGWPTGIPQPLSSNINLTEPGQVRPNLVIIPIGADGTLSFFSQRGAHLVGDVAGYFVEVTTAQTAGRIVPLGPARLFDTRPDEPAPGPKGKVPPGGTIEIPVLDRAGIPAAGVAAVIVNLTGTDATDRGFVTAWGDGDRPTASVLNLPGPGATAPNLAIVPVGADGSIRLFSQSGAHLLADVAGYITDATADELIQGLLVPLAPVRVFDTRPDEPAAGPKGFVGADSTINVPHVDVVGIPADAAGVIINVTASAAADRGFITGWPEGPGRPNSSILNLAGPGDTRPNLAILPIFATGRLSFYASRGAHLLADTFGYLLD